MTHSVLIPPQAHEVEAHLRSFAVADARSAGLQLATTVVGLVLGWMAMVWSLHVSYALTLLFSLPTAGFYVRLFALQHDCGHGSFLRSRRANDLVGMLICVPLLTPYYEWRKSHAIHHRDAGDLDNRTINDIYTMTVVEYGRAPLHHRLAYRAVRNPFVLLVVAPLYVFLLKHRVKGSMTAGLPRGKNLLNVHLTTLGYLAFAWAMSSWIGLEAFLRVQIPCVLLSGAAGVFLFFVQHQFPDTYWERGDRFSRFHTGLLGSAYLAYPRFWQFWIGNLGFHHVHHLNVRVPNYRLEACHKSHPTLAAVRPISLRESVANFRLKLWDERRRALVPFGAVEQDIP